jgi:two-component system nitrogen regulation sensor histidine kinase GlnL
MHAKGPQVGTGYEGSSFESVLQDHFTCGVVVVGAEGKIITLTPRAEKLLHLPPGQKQNGSVAALPPALREIIEASLTRGEAITDRHIILPPTAHTLSVTTIPVSNGKKTGTVVVLLNDISSAGKLEREMRRLDRLASIGTLSASMAHEIKNALVPVKTFVDLLIERNPGVELAGTVRREIDRVDTIVGSILKYAAPPRPAFSRVRLHEILEHSLRLAEHRVEGKMISFNRQFNATSDSLNGDDHQLEQAFVNLMLNAVEAMGSEGTLTIGTDMAAADAGLQVEDGNGLSEFLRVKISDTGTGIPHEQMVSIFEPFFTTKTNGTGLGLPVTQRIIEEHKGLIRVESQPAKGTTFTIFLPRSQSGHSND